MSKMAKTIIVQEMHCRSCEKTIEEALGQLNGVITVKANYAKNTVNVEYNDLRCSSDDINEVIIREGYIVGEEMKSSAAIKNIIGLLGIFLAVLLLGQFTGGFDMSSKLKGEVTYLILFMIGIFTSFHCVGMCGGIMISQTITTGTQEKSVSVLPPLSYNLGRVLGYTLLGGAVGAIGSVISLSIGFMSGVAIVAGTFMILMGINMFGIPIFRKYMSIPWPAYSPKLKSKTPFMVGIFNGLMPCGPLQTMQLYALGTGSPLDGAIAMFIFAMGTLPLMLFFGMITGMVSKDSTKKIMKISGVCVMAMGIIMANRGLAIAGIQTPFSTFAAQTNRDTSAAIKADINNGVQTIKIVANNQGYVPNVLYVQKGIPVRWIVDGKQINSCNNQIIIPALNIKKKLMSGENIIEFTPQNEDLKFSCWMGMITGIIKVVDDVNAVDVSKEKAVIPPSSGCCNADGASSTEPRTSIYGDDLSKAPIERLIHKAAMVGDEQTLNVMGIGYELEPLISVITKEKRTLVKFDFSKFENPEGKWEIVDYGQKKVIYTFEGKKEVAAVELNNQSLGTLGIYKDKKVVGIIEVVDDLNQVDFKKIKAKF